MLVLQVLAVKCLAGCVEGPAPVIKRGTTWKGMFEWKAPLENTERAQQLPEHVWVTLLDCFACMETSPLAQHPEEPDQDDRGSSLKNFNCRFLAQKRCELLTPRSLCFCVNKTLTTDVLSNAQQVASRGSPTPQGATA